MKAQRAASLHGLMLPAVIFVVLMVIFPFGYAFWLSLQDYRIGQAVKFIGFGNYTALIQHHGAHFATYPWSRSGHAFAQSATDERFGQNCHGVAFHASPSRDWHDVNCDT
jgi:ABC-type sugar transport system permease subunit